MTIFNGLNKLNIMDSIREKFRENGFLEENLEEDVRRRLLDLDNIDELQELIHFYSFSYPLREDVVHKIKSLESIRDSELSALCLKALHLYWGVPLSLSENKIRAILSQCNFDEQFEEWQILYRLSLDNAIFFNEFKYKIEAFKVWACNEGFDLVFD